MQPIVIEHGKPSGGVAASISLTNTPYGNIYLELPSFLELSPNVPRTFCTDVSADVFDALSASIPVRLAAIPAAGDAHAKKYIGVSGIMWEHILIAFGYLTQKIQQLEMEAAFGFTDAHRRAVKQQESERAAVLAQYATKPSPASPAAPGTAEAPLPFSLDKHVSDLATAHLAPARRALESAAQRIVDQTALRLPDRVKVDVVAKMPDELKESLREMFAQEEVKRAEHQQSEAKQRSEDNQQLVSAVRELTAAQRETNATLLKPKKRKTKVTRDQYGKPAGTETTEEVIDP